MLNIYEDKTVHSVLPAYLKTTKSPIFATYLINLSGVQYIKFKGNSLEFDVQTGHVITSDLKVIPGSWVHWTIS